MLLAGLWTAHPWSRSSRSSISLVCGLLLACCGWRGRPFNWLALAYINIFRGVPALVSVIWVYFGLALVLGCQLHRLPGRCDRAVPALQRIPRRDLPVGARRRPDRAHRGRARPSACARSRIFFSVTLPQAVKIALPNIGSMFIGMVKDTSTFTVIGLLEVVRVTQNLVATTFQPFVLLHGGGGHLRPRRLRHRSRLPADRGLICPTAARAASRRAAARPAQAPHRAARRGGRRLTAGCPAITGLRTSSCTPVGP